MKVKKNDKVKVEYTGSFDNGDIFDTSNHEGHSHPLEFEAGSGMVIKGFDDAIIGMELNEEKNIHLKPEEAYGTSNPRLMIKISKDEYERLKMQADIDLDLLKQLVRSLKDIKEGRVIRVK